MCPQFESGRRHQANCEWAKKIEMNTPVIIAAHNESAGLAKTLDRLTNDVEPIVVANGCNDDTAEIAQAFGATVIELEEKSKTRAIQYALGYLGDRSLEPVLFLDADTYPMSSKWATIMTRAVDTADITPRFSSSGAWFRDGNSVLYDGLRTVHFIQKVMQARRVKTALPSGRNMATRFNYETLDAVLSMPDYWPGEDQAIRDIIVKAGGIALEVINPFAYAITTDDRGVGILTRLVKGPDYVARTYWESYLAEAPRGSEPYNPPSWYVDKLQKQEENLALTSTNVQLGGRERT